MSNFFNAVYDYNICTYYLLPLLKLNKYRFGHRNFRQSYVNSRNPHILYIEVAWTPTLVDGDKGYQGIQKKDGKLFLVYILPDEWASDIQLFLKGHYSLMSDDAKEMIRTHGGMRNNQVDVSTGRPWTDARLMAIDTKSPNVRTFLRLHIERELKVILPNDAELIAPPNENCFMDDIIQEHNITVNLVAH